MRTAPLRHQLFTIDQRGILLRNWGLLFLLALVAYSFTASRGPQWQDSGLHILRVVTHEPVNSLGLALSHPLHHWFGRFAAALSAFEPAFAVTLVSALFAAVAVANVFGCVFTVARRTSPAWIAALSVGLCHSHWQMATRAETYTLVVAILSAECWCLIAFARSRRPEFLWLMAFFNGLGLANHNFALLTTPVLLYAAISGTASMKNRPITLFVCAFFWLSASIPYTGLVIGQCLRSRDLAGTMQSALFGFGYRDEVLNTSITVYGLLLCAGFMLLNFPNLTLLHSARGIVSGDRKSLPPLARRGLLLGLTLHFLFVVRYPVVDQYMFFLPTYLYVSLFSGLGFAALTNRDIRRPDGRFFSLTVALLAATPVFYALAPAIARRAGVLQAVASNRPYRDDYIYLLTPWSRAERSAEVMSAEALRLAGDAGLIVVEDRSPEFAIRYRLLCGGFSKVELIRDTETEAILAAAQAGRSIVLVPTRRSAPRAAPPLGVWRREGDLYRLSFSPE